MMQCPICSVDLVMTERQGVEIDYCPKCRGIWLDRGKLDKILERSAAPVPSRGDDRRSSEMTNYRDGHDRDHENYDHDDDRYKGKHGRRGGFLGDLFDF